MTELAPKSPRDVLLAANQRDIVERLLDVDRVPTIARATKRSVDTVRQTLRAIYSQLGVRSAEELVAGLVAGTFNVRASNQEGRKYDLRSGLLAIDRALTTMRRDNARKGTSRRRTAVRLHEDEMDAILAARAETAKAN